MIRDLIALDHSSKVWIYQSNRDFEYEELDEAREMIFNFLDQWTSHNEDLLTYGNIFHRRFLAIFVDETHTSASGCSIDKLVRFTEELGNEFKIDFFNRNNFSYLINEDIYFIDSDKLTNAYRDGKIDDNVLFFDHLVATKHDFLKKWLVPLKNSWHKKFVK
ncbi:MAG: hypothetical protein RLZZ546_3089 [Bacteroidota bacterium]|jgi:hypothetical protein